MEITGKVSFIGATETVGSNGFKKRLLVLDCTTKPEYPNLVPLEFCQKGVDKLDGVQVGSWKTVSFDPQGREYNGKYYVNLRAWRLSDAQAPPDAPTGGDAQPGVEEKTGGLPPLEDMIPF